MTAHGINFVHKDNAGAVALGLIKEVTHAAGTNADKHFYEFRARNAEEWNTSLAANSLSKQRFTSTGASNKEYPFRNAGTKLNETLWVLEKFNNFLKFFFSFIR